MVQGETRGRVGSLLPARAVPDYSARLLKMTHVVSRVTAMLVILEKNTALACALKTAVVTGLTRLMTCLHNDITMMCHRNY